MEIHSQKKHFATGLISVGLVLIGLAIYLYINPIAPKEEQLEFKSIDTMKYSRDLAREKKNDKSFDKSIEGQVEAIAKTGATHVAIATPYDEEFAPMLKRWVEAARRNNLKVWFRGNFAGWEGWFGYTKISRDEHLRQLSAFLNSNEDIFEDGDVFTACPECENGGPGDPRTTGDVAGHRKFLIDEYSLSKGAFIRMNKKVVSNYDSMNYDVAKLVMDKETTARLGGIVTIDHYVKSPKQLNDDIDAIALLSGGKVVLGEYGAPIPDIHGEMSALEQAEWLENLFTLISTNKNLVGLNYWVNVGGSTQLWNANGTKRAAVEKVTSFYEKF